MWRQRRGLHPHRTGGGNDTAQVALDTVLPAGMVLTVKLGDGADSWSRSRATADIVYGGPGNDTIDGHGGHDRLHGDGGNDVISGGVGNDRVHAGFGAGTASGGTGNDKVYGGAGNDKVYANPGKDTVRGDGGRDVVSGGLGADLISGDAGNDRLLDEHRGQAASFLSADILPGRGTGHRHGRLLVPAR